jgi:hypothetical protein
MAAYAGDSFMRSAGRKLGQIMIETGSPRQTIDSVALSAVRPKTGRTMVDRNCGVVVFLMTREAIAGCIIKSQVSMAILTSSVSMFTKEFETRL